MKIYAFIFCRSGSKELKNKNIKKFNGISLLKRNINLIKKCKKIDKIFVSTDSEEYKKEALEAGALVPILRPKHLASDESSELDSWKFMVNYLENNNDDFDLFVSIPVVSPLKSLDDIEGCIDEFIKNKPDLLVTVKDAYRHPAFNMVKEKESNLEIYDENLNKLYNRQSFPKVYDLLTVVYILSKNNVKQIKDTLFNSGFKILKYKIDKLNSIDIDDKVDFKMAEHFHKERIKNNVNFSVLNNILLDDKIAIVTGGFGNIGEKIVETLLELNSHVIVIDIENDSTKDKIKIINNKFETEIDFYNLDLLNEEKIKTFCNIINKKYSKIDILINCAALVGSSKLKGWTVPFENQSSQAFDACMNINTKAPILLIQGLLESLKKSKNAKVINISSIYGIIGNDFSMYDDTNMESPIAYSISKSGLNIMTKYLASLYGKYNMCFNSIVLGGIFRNQDKKFVKKYIDKTPLNKMGTEDDIKGMISFLSSNLSNYVTGQNYVLDGGITSKC